MIKGPEWGCGGAAFIAEHLYTSAICILMCNVFLATGSKNNTDNKIYLFFFVLPPDKFNLDIHFPLLYFHFGSQHVLKE